MYGQATRQPSITNQYVKDEREAEHACSSPERPMQRMGLEQKKFRFPVAIHLIQAGRPLSTPHGGRNYIINQLA